jgi:hypothetical protein
LTGPMLVARTKDLTGSFAGMLPLIAIVLAVSVILPYLTKKPPPRTDGEPEPVVTLSRGKRTLTRRRDAVGQIV